VKTSPDELVSQDLASRLASISWETGRQTGVLINRKGEVTHVMVGDDAGILIPDISGFRLGRAKLRGLRCIHTHLRGEDLNADDFADLALLRLDAMAALGVDSNGRPDKMRIAHLLPPNPDGERHRLLPPKKFQNLNLAFDSFISALESEIASKQARSVSVQSSKDRAILIHVSGKPKHEIEERISELKELCRTAGATVVDVVVQRPTQINPKYLLGKGKIREVVASGLQKGADLLIFDHELTPAQVRAIGELADIRVLDRTQLILDIFARRAHTPDGKVQVELAQLKYILPRLAGKGISMSRLMGGIGGRGPGETKLEIDRRRTRDRIAHLERRLKTLSKGRSQRRARRIRSGIPIISIVGYANAGKSTLLNILTRSEVLTENLLFATLDTATRRLRFPREREAIVTDTVGFLRELPQGLVGAFKATLEELDDADLLLHVVDASNPAMEAQINAVEILLDQLELGDKPKLMVFNKTDLLPPEQIEALPLGENAVAASALAPSSLAPLMKELEARLWPSQAQPMSQTLP